MTYIPNSKSVVFLDNASTSTTLGSTISNAFERSVGTASFGNNSQIHTTMTSAIHILASATNDSDANHVLARIGTSSRIGSAISHKSSIVMLPVTVMTTHQNSLSLTSNILDTGDIVTADNLNTFIISCGA